MVEGNLKENSWLKAEECDPEELCSGLQTYSQIELCAYYLLRGSVKVVCAYSPLLKRGNLGSYMQFLCSCARFIIKFMAQLTLGMYLDVLRFR